MNQLTILLTSAPKDGGGAGWVSLLPWILIIAVFYFFMIRPQMKKAKQQRQFRESLSKGDRVVTIGGIHGKIEELKDNVAIISVEGGNRLKVEKSAISMDSSTQLTEEQKK